MASLAEQLTTDLATAMRSGETRKRDVIRFLRAAIKNAEIDRRRSLNDAEVQDVIRYQIKQRRDSIEMFRNGGRDDLADEEEAQIAILQPYLPAQLDDAELQFIVVKASNELGASSPKDMGRVMPVVIKEVAGRAEGRRVSQAVNSELVNRAATSKS